MMTTTATTLDDELLSRCLVLAVNEGQQQTQAIHRRQREDETLDGLLARRRREGVLAIHRNAQRLLAAIPVVNPYAHELTFPDGSTRARRDHKKLLTLIRAIALLHQHQRDRKAAEHEGAAVEYIEVTRTDIDMARRLIDGALSGADELPPHTRHVLSMLDKMVRTVAGERGIEVADYRFSRREARERLGLGGTQLWTHLRRLVEAEYLIVHPSKRGRGVAYELVLDGVPGCTYDADVRGSEVVVRGSFGPDSGQVRGAPKGPSREKPSPSTTPRSGSAISTDRPPSKKAPSRRPTSSQPNGPRP